MMQPSISPVFISYARANSEFISRLIADLQAAHINVWIDREGLKPGTRNWEDALREAIRSASAVMLVASPASRRSKYVQAEIDIAEMYERVIYPVWVEGDYWIDCVPMSLSKVQHIDVRGDLYEDGLVQIIKALIRQEQLRNPQIVEPELTLPPDFIPRNPYKGLRAFRESDHNDFFGREGLIAELVAALRDGIAPPRFLCVVGPSGSGKSSVVMAGLLPALRSGAISGSNRWFYIDPMVLGNHPLESLTVALARALPDRSLRSIRDDLDDPSTRGMYLLAKQMVLPEQHLVLYIDQLEELFTLTTTEDERQQFINLLTTAIDEPDGQIIVLASLRADFYDRPLQYTQLADLMEHHSKIIPPMSISDLREVIEKPAVLSDVQMKFESGLVGELVFDVRDQVGALPLLQFTLDQLFQQRDGQRLTHSTYERIGGVQGALAKHAEATYHALPSDEHRKLARALFLRLIEPGATELDTTRRRASLTELKLADKTQIAPMFETANAFTQARLLVADEDTIEVAHEALIREWPRLHNWLTATRDDIRLMKIIGQDALAWMQRDQPQDRLYRGTQLSEAQDWVIRHLPTDTEAQFIQASTVFQEQLSANELRRKHRELLLQRGIVSVFSMLLIVAIAIGVFIIASQRRLDRQLQEQLSLTNANRARQALNEGNNHEALFYAHEANLIEDPPLESQRVIAEVLYRVQPRVQIQQGTLGHSVSKCCILEVN